MRGKAGGRGHNHAHERGQTASVAESLRGSTTWAHLMRIQEEKQKQASRHKVVSGYERASSWCYV